MQELVPLSRTIEQAWGHMQVLLVENGPFQMYRRQQGGGPPHIDVTGPFFEYYWMGRMGWSQCWRGVVLPSLIPIAT
jgi:hypothetical protein